MPIEIKCRCGRTYRVKEEHAGKTVKCNHCANKMQVPQLEEPLPALQPPLDDDDFFSTSQPVLRPPLDDEDLRAPASRSTKTEAKSARETPPVDPVFQRDVFFFHCASKSGARQATEIRDEDKRLLMVAVQPKRPNLGVLRILLMVVVPFVMVIVISAAIMFFAHQANIPPWDALGIKTLIGMGIGLVVWVFAMAIVLGPKTDVVVYRDSSNTEALLHIQKSKKQRPGRFAYNVHAPNGILLARLEKGSVLDILREPLNCFRPNGSLLCKAVKGLLLGPIPFFLPTFLLKDARTNRVIGSFKFGFLRKTLDLSDDPEQEFDRRILVALAVILEFRTYSPAGRSAALLNP
jgi:hypothetical protein